MNLVRQAARQLPPAQREAIHTFIRRVQRSIHHFVLQHAVRNRFAAAAYYSFVNHEFLREARAVAAGQLRYASDHRTQSGSYYLLRRNIHRLEKGLIMRPRRRVFAADFIDETVEIFAHAMRSSGGEWNSELVWAEDVLSDYFAAVDVTTAKVAPAYAQYLNIEKVAREPDAVRAVPYRRNLTLPPPVNFEDFMALTRRRRSVRWYDDRPVDRMMINRALEAAAQSPSACNRQPFNFRIFDKPEMAQRVTAVAMGTKGFAQQVPAVAVVIGQLRAYPFERDRHVIYIDGSLAAMSFMFALESMGIASCPINWPDQEPHEARIREIVPMEEDERVVMLISFGWPDPTGMVPFSSKRSVADMATFNRIA
ncbi:nitroreductase family protein [Novosphingobium sp. M1R2S20]|uniref:Nitroreductase family protein n=1 Tax=Novosphingobium rhizovicinum TaxID=3228928 RepID=A0ABV3R6R7_9SPHN